jgi:hypothetical protein
MKGLCIGFLGFSFLWQRSSALLCEKYFHPKICSKSFVIMGNNDGIGKSLVFVTLEYI